MLKENNKKNNNPAMKAFIIIKSKTFSSPQLNWWRSKPSPQKTKLSWWARSGGQLTDACWLRLRCLVLQHHYLFITPKQHKALQKN